MTTIDPTDDLDRTIPVGERERVVLPVANVAVDAITEDEAVRTIVERASAGEGGLVVTPNVDHLRLIASGSWLGWVYADADLRLADGMPLVWASRLQGRALPERVAGSDLLWSLSKAAAENDLPVYFLGGMPGSADAVATLFTEMWPSLRVAGTSCPPKGFEREPGAIDAIAREVAAAGPAVVFTGLGAPKQDYLNALLRRSLPSAWYLGVGASFDMAAGSVQRAPEWAQKAGVEWLYRLAQEPRRMAKRYLVHDLPFAARLLAASAAEGRAARR
jgi:N-acetylglucosaminyldiphosphoundecaprenol N-acetyl-beta-D-mannosaminyltransferase